VTRWRAEPSPAARAEAAARPRRWWRELAGSVAIALSSATGAAAEPARPPLDVGRLWDEAKRWAQEQGTVPEDCVFELRLDPKTNTPRDGRAVTCDEPYRSPFYPWPAPSRPGARFDARDIRAYAREMRAASPESSRGRPLTDDALFETCGLVVAFTAEGVAAEGIECHWRDGSVRGQRANAGFVVEAEGGRRVTSRLYDRLGHLRDRAVRDIAVRVAALEQRDTAVEVQIEGVVVRRDGHRVRLRGHARPVFGGSPNDPGVVTTEADLVVEYPDEDALRPGYYLGGEHCFKERRDTVSTAGATVSERVYGPCALGPDQFWMFEQFPPGRKTVMHGPYAEYGDCERDRRRMRTGAAPVEGHCQRKPKTAFRMRNDGSLVVPPGAPSFE
jgi:hypothetical protein